MTATETDTRPAISRAYRPGSLEILGLVLLAAILFRGQLRTLFGTPEMAT